MVSKAVVGNGKPGPSGTESRLQNGLADSTDHGFIANIPRFGRRNNSNRRACRLYIKRTFQGIHSSLSDEGVINSFADNRLYSCFNTMKGLHKIRQAILQNNAAETMGIGKLRSK